MVKILYSIRPEVGRFCLDDTIFRGKNDEPEVPEEIIASQAEVQEEMTQKVTRELDQMFIEDDEGWDYFLNVSKVRAGQKVREGDRVKFVVFEGQISI